MKQMSNKIKNIIMPGFLLPAIAGGITGALIFLFKLAANCVISGSGRIYTFVRANPFFLPILIIGAILIAFASYLFRRFDETSAGGGISTSIAIVRGVLSFRWFRNLVSVFCAAMLSYFVGVPLGNEGPSVQMGTAIGSGTSNIFAKKSKAWHRYVMTGSASAGFGAATGAPLSGILFALEELQERISPMIFLSASSAVAASYGVSELLCLLTGKSSALFHLSVGVTLPMKNLWMVLVVGVMCGLAAVLFAKCHTAFGTFLRRKGDKLPVFLKLTSVFLFVSVIGYFFAECLGSGHDLIEVLFEGDGVWYMLLLILVLRMLLMLTANNIGVTGGLFVPNLTFGALIGALCAILFRSIGILSSEYCVILVTVAMSAYLCANSCIPITALCFGIEVLCGGKNILSFAVAVLASYAVVKLLKSKTCDEISIERREEEYAEKAGNRIFGEYEVGKDSFAVGKLKSDLPLPFGSEISGKTKGIIKCGDVLKVSCFAEDKKALEEIFGKQPEESASVA